MDELHKLPAIMTTETDWKILKCISQVYELVMPRQVCLNKIAFDPREVSLHFMDII